MVDKEYCIRKTLKIVYKINAKDNNGNISETKIAEIASRKLANELITEETKGNKNTIRAFADRFVNDPYNKKLWMSEGFTEGQYKDVLRKYLNIVFEVKDPTGVDLNNNEIFDMSYAVLTSESNVARALKPGGFDEHKHMAYAVAAFRIPEVRKKYPNFDTLLKMDTKEIGKLIERNDKNLIFLDTQLEYYDHNNSASSLLGISAVNSVAHAILVDDNIGIDLTGIAIPTIAGFKFGQVTSSFVSPTTANTRALADILNSETSTNQNTSTVTKIISGGQTGVDTIGLQVAKSLGIETGGTAPKGFLRERGIDNEDISSYGLIEISDEQQADYTNRKGKRDPYTGRTELNVRNSDGTVYFSTASDSAGKIATKRAADEFNKPFIENPTAKKLRGWIDKNGIKILNVAGNRGSKLDNGPEIANIIKEALTSLPSVMRLDPSIAADGASIAETLGSNVAASADAAKDPVLNFMNLNPQTFNVYTTLIRSGMPNSVATLLMSSKVLADAVTKSNAKTLAGEWSTPESVLRELISPEFLESIGYSPSSVIFDEELTRDELIRGLYEDDTNINLKITNALVELFDVSKKVRLADQITRFNSASSAVGPTTLDNYIFQKKLDTLDKESSLIDMSTGNPIGAKGLLDKHQMLYEFSRAYDLANSILIDGMPQTRAFIESMESIYAVPNKVAGLELKFGLPSIVINDRALVGKLREFFTSWSAMKAGLVSYSELEFLSKEFPKTITKKKNEHSDNYLVQNLYLNIDNRSGFPIIAMNISKIEKTSRDMLTASWADLYAKDKEFALNLFKYSCFRGGLGFSPKTFMNVLPIQMKLDIEGYLKLFKEPETLTPQEANLLYKQFVSNNAMNNKLAPIKKIKPKEVREDGRVIISKKDSRAESFRNVRFFKTKDGESYKLYECVGGFENGPAYRIYKEIPMLGAEGNFIELSTNNIDKSLFDVKFDLEDDGSMKLTPDVNDIPADRLRTIVEARKILDDVLTQNQQELTKLRMSSLEGEAKQVFIQRASARLSTILQEKGYTPIKEETFNEMLKQLDLC